MKDLGKVVVHLATDEITITGEDFDALMNDRAQLHKLREQVKKLEGDLNITRLQRDSKMWTDGKE